MQGSQFITSMCWRRNKFLREGVESLQLREHFIKLGNLSKERLESALNQLFLIINRDIESTNDYLLYYRI